MTPQISRSRGGETAIDPDELSRELLTDVGVSAPGRYAGQVERLDAGTIGNLAFAACLLQSPQRFRQAICGKFDDTRRRRWVHRIGFDDLDSVARGRCLKKPKPQMYI